LDPDYATVIRFFTPDNYEPLFIVGGTFCHPTFYPVFLHPLFQVFPEAESAVVAGRDVFALLFAAAELSPEIVVLAAGREIFALLFVAAELSPEIVALAAEPEVSEPGVVSVADVAEPQASVDIAVAFDFLVPVSVVVVEVYSSEHPKFLAFPNVEHFASSSSSVEVVG
jgi:hypothetical protein